MNTYTITECTTEQVLTINCETVLDVSKIYSFVEKPSECWSVKSIGLDFDQPLYTLVDEYDSCIDCQGTSYECSTIIEDDFSFVAVGTQNLNEKLISITSSVVISNGIESHALFSYELPFTQNYVAGYLETDDSFQMDWEQFMPLNAINGVARLTASMGQLTVRLPNVVNWRSFQSLPQLSAVFGVDATNNWLWYQQNGWNLSQRVEISNEIGNYVDSIDFTVRDYDDNLDVDWIWEFFRLSDNAQLSAPISNEKVRVYIKANQNSLPNAIEGAVVTIEGIGSLDRWMISSDYDSKTNTPLQPLTGQTRLKMTANPNDFELEFVFDPSKIDTQNGVKFTARSYSGNGYSERNIIDFPVAKIPPKKIISEFESDCCDCLPELKLASSTAEELIYNDITGVVHKNQTSADTCEFKIFKGNELLVNNGLDYPNGFPNDANVSAFVFNWKWYLVNHGMGCYKIEKHFTVAGLPMIEEIGKYELLEYTPENAQGTVRVLYQNDFQTLWEDSTINYAGSGFEDSYRFRGMFGRWQPNVMSESNFSVLNENRVASIKSKDTYLLNHFHATECHIKRLHKIVMHAAIWRMSDHNPSNTLQEKKIYECVLDPESKEDITYNAGSRVTGIEIVLSKRQQNSVSLFSGSIQTPKGATWFLPTVTGGGGACLPSPISIAGTYINDLPSGDSLNIITTDQNDVPIVPISGTVSGGIATVKIELSKQWTLQFLTGNADITAVANVGNIATFASGSGTGIGTLTISTDGTTYGAMTYPFTPISGTTYYFKRSDTTGFAEYKMIE